MKEDYNIITSKNKICDFSKYMKNPNMINNISENIYPVMYVENKPVYEGDKLLFRYENGQVMREVKWQHRAIISGNKEWIKLWSFSVKLK